MDIYLYKYSCKRFRGWWTKSGFRHIHVNNTVLPEDKLDEFALEDAQKHTNFSNCDIALLQKFNISINNVTNYAALTSIPFSIPNNNVLNGK